MNTTHYTDMPCGDCDPCLGGRPDQCALFPSPNTTERAAKVINTEFADLLTDAAFQLGRLSGENLQIYAKTFASLASAALAKAKL